MKRNIKTSIKNVKKNYGKIEYSDILNICNEFEKTLTNNKKDDLYNI